MNECYFQRDDHTHQYRWCLEIYHKGGNFQSYKIENPSKYALEKAENCANYLDWPDWPVWTLVCIEFLLAILAIYSLIFNHSFRLIILKTVWNWSSVKNRKYHILCRVRVSGSGGHGEGAWNWRSSQKPEERSKVEPEYIKLLKAQFLLMFSQFIYLMFPQLISIFFASVLQAPLANTHILFCNSQRIPSGPLKLLTPKSQVDHCHIYNMFSRSLEGPLGTWLQDPQDPPDHKPMEPRTNRTTDPTSHETKSYIHWTHGLGPSGICIFVENVLARIIWWRRAVLFRI